MTERLRKAIAQATSQVASLANAAERMSTEEQDELAGSIEALANELRWEELLDDTSRADVVDRLADEALADLAAGNTCPLDDALSDEPH